MTTKHIGEHSFSLKKGSLTNKNFTIYDDYANGVKRDLSIYNTAEMFVTDKRGGESLFTLAGTITQGTSNVSFDIPKSDTVNITHDAAFYTTVLSDSDDGSLDWKFLEGTIEFID
ncbi:MAG: hypothetical protein PQ612_06075 [Rickettsiales bacterium]|nr:hypothetical protein [Pseudomonadota bacterium]MDA0966891.1 hypothetical protein [Pseudomonadota bacterium]MDG4543566.1 hypothetical protein [Rickettsiales bacterium]MDG4545714.1 hypothetical protein [Rickettsiales bacterium]MDG4547513.1 hypothetical protein [Rickettsiales bacterium]